MGLHAQVGVWVRVAVAGGCIATPVGWVRTFVENRGKTYAALGWAREEDTEEDLPSFFGRSLDRSVAPSFNRRVSQIGLGTYFYPRLVPHLEERFLYINPKKTGFLISTKP